MQHIETFQQQFNTFINGVNEENRILREENIRLNQALSDSAFAWTNFFTLTAEEGKFIPKAEAQGYIDKYQSAGFGPIASFFIKTDMVLKVINESSKLPVNPTDPPLPIQTPEHIQIILGKKTDIPATEFTLILIGAMANGDHLYRNGEVLENVWPDVANPLPGHANTTIHIPPPPAAK